MDKESNPFKSYDYLGTSIENNGKIDEEKREQEKWEKYTAVSRNSSLGKRKYQKKCTSRWKEVIS